MINTDDNNPRSYLITGAAGFIGSNIAHALNSEGHRIIICDRFRTGPKWKNVQDIIIADYVTPDEVVNWIHAENRNIDAIIHMGAISSTTETDVDKIILNNFKLSSNLWQAAIKYQIPFIYASSAATYGDGGNGFDDDETATKQAKLRPLNPYGWSKLLFDRRVISERDAGKSTPPQWAGLKFFNVYGPNEHHKGDMRSVINKVYPLIKHDQQISLFKSHRNDYANGAQLRDFIYVHDCVKIVKWLVANRSVSGIFNVGTGQPRSFADLVNIIGLSLNKTPKIYYIDMPEEIQKSYQYFTKANTLKLRERGYQQAFYTLEEGIFDYIKNDLEINSN
jgi:ADP-L-glycero-D-manno-heptose 6-epimerase